MNLKINYGKWKKPDSKDCIWFHLYDSLEKANYSDIKKDISGYQELAADVRIDCKS